MKPHKHAALIKAWADGTEIEYLNESTGLWELPNNPSWSLSIKYRIKSADKRIPFNPETWKGFSKQGWRLEYDLGGGNLHKFIGLTAAGDVVYENKNGIVGVSNSKCIFMVPPECKKVIKYKRYLYRSTNYFHIGIVYSDAEETEATDREDFIRRIDTEWQEVEI